MEFKGHKYTKAIFWLPKRSEIDQGLLLDVNIPTRAYNHPVLILSHKPGGRGYLDMVDLVPLSSSPHTDENGYIESNYLPIAPSKKHPLTRVQLKLCGHQRIPRLSKCSYVCVEQVYKVPLNVLQRYPFELPEGAFQLKMQADSFITVRTHVTRWMHQLEPCAVKIGDRGCLLQEPRFLGGNCTEVKLEAGLQDPELKIRFLELQVTLLKLQLSLQTSAGLLCTMPGDESHIPGGKNTDDGKILPSVPMTVMAPAEPAKDGGDGQHAYIHNPNQAALKLHCVEDFRTDEGTCIWSSPQPSQVLEK